MNIMLTSAGRRNYLLKYFRDSLGGNGRVLAADCSDYAAALQEADGAFVVPPVNAPGYVEGLLELCLAQRVGLLFSLNDHELAVLAAARERFSAQGVQIVVSRPGVISLAADKLMTAEFLKEVGLGTPVTYASLEEALRGLEDGEVVFPLVVKPRWGTASLGIEVVDDLEQLRLAWRYGQLRLPKLGLGSGASEGEGLIIQERLPGQEYGLDIINDLNGRYRTTFIKRKLAMRGGETDKAVTATRPDLLEVGRRIGKALGHVGNLDCDVFVHGKECFVLELNPRFGGGYPFSAEAGADVPGALIAWAEGREPPVGWNAPREGVASAKCDRLVRIMPQHLAGFL
ncbi:ATP-grasp domain-containing protein [Halomonas saccharevitans]|uniref:Carbamoyl-phosphate synthase large subunit n=1 Tax=Halomonas saccharevitans TaxID=416872 RepID=A0A1I7BDT3_9GAMM|nr:ATP-grasp domain-containing protein [Halomonas saccharevitans]SFT85317.1 carbamoyl-phosphate synthase large subunit [Halomonas saccharevitans]